MDFFIPSNIIEEKLCNSCNKYLTVLPVKIYPGGIIKCGRCTRYGDGGTISLYSLIIERSIFRCINRFDGCKELLMSSQVIQHEQKCNQRFFSCPICINPERMSTFLFMYHFYNKHETSIIKYPFFKINNFEEIDQYFLYNFDDDLFLISVEDTRRHLSESRSGISDNSDTNKVVEIKINLLRLGANVDDNFHCNFFVNNGTTCTEIYIPCLSYPTDTKLGSTVSINAAEQLVSNITVFFNIKQCTKYVFGMPAKQVRLNQSLIATSTFLKLFKSKNLYFQKRKIFLGEELNILSPEIIRETGITITSNERRIELNLTCLYCSLVTSDYLSIGNARLKFNVCFVKMPNGQYNLLCFDCSPLLNMSSTKTLITKDQFQNIFFFCIWKCGNYFSSKYLYAHELTCKNQQQLHLCPINKCTFTIKLHESEKHFTEIHPLIPLQATSLILVSLNTTKSPIIMTCLVSNVFINVKFLWNEPYWIITLHQQFEGVKPRASLYSKDNKILGVVKEKGEFMHVDEIYIKCYLIVPNKMLEIEECLISHKMIVTS